MIDVVKRDWIMPLKREKFRNYRTQYRILQDWKKKVTRIFRNIKENPQTYSTVNCYIYVSIVYIVIMTQIKDELKMSGKSTL